MMPNTVADPTRVPVSILASMLRRMAAAIRSQSSAAGRILSALSARAFGAEAPLAHWRSVASGMPVSRAVLRITPPFAASLTSASARCASV
ncbi:MAG TPA: hypothetical protein VEI97_08310 [bacterium]|nr:hypothetical protein [bacterium]